MTIAQYKVFMRETSYRRSFQGNGFEQTPDDHPAYGISYNDAWAFTIWLSAREHAVYRLPSEAEWEFAARGGAGNREPWGLEPGKPQVDGNWGRTNPDDLRRSPPPTTPVGSFPKDRSAFGLFDMAGNVDEWCLDDYDASYYTWSPERNPFGPVEDSGVKVLRGGAWNQLPGGSEFAMRRSRAAANQPYTGYGFRVVREVQRDPAGLLAGSNLYRYVDNAPVAYSDPDGLMKRCCRRVRSAPGSCHCWLVLDDGQTIGGYRFGFYVYQINNHTDDRPTPPGSM